jgi:hypothetical protein
MLKKYGKSLTFLSLANNNITYINESIRITFTLTTFSICPLAVGDAG